MSYNHNLEKLLDLIYDAGCQRGSFGSAIMSIMRDVKAIGACLSVVLKSQGCRATHDIINPIGFSLEDVRLYKQKFAVHDFRLDKLLTLSPGDISADGHDLALSDIHSSIIYNEYYSRIGMGYAMGVLLSSFGEGHAYLTLYRESGDVPFSIQEISILKALAPHLGRSLMLYDRMAKTVRLESEIFSVMDHFPVPSILIDDRFNLKFSNKAAQEFFKQTTLPLRIDGGSLCAVRAPDMNELCRVIKDALIHGHGEFTSPRHEVLRWQRTDKIGNLNILVSPLFVMPNSDITTSTRILLHFSDNRAARDLNFLLLAKEFGLTSTEARIGSLVAAGSTLGDIAKRRCVSLETVRSQVKSLLRKTHTHSQGQLVSVLLRSLASLHHN